MTRQFSTDTNRVLSPDGDAGAQLELLTHPPRDAREALAQLDEAPPTMALAPLQLETLHAHPVASFLLGLAEGSRPAMLSSLHALARGATGGAVGAWSFAWWSLEYQHTQAMRAQAARECRAPATARKRLAALAGVLRTCKRLGLIDPTRYAAITDWDGIKGTSAPTGRHLTRNELRALFEALTRDATPHGIRDTAMLGVAAQTGARRAELVAINVRDYNPSTGTFRLLRTKGRKAREAYVHDEGHAALARWIAIRGDEPGPLFCRIRPNGRILPTVPISAHRLWEVLRERAEAAGLVEHLSPHDLRRTFGGELLERGADLSTVQQLMGHASAATTAGYDKRTAETRRRAARLMQLPIAL